MGARVLRRTRQRPWMERVGGGGGGGGVVLFLRSSIELEPDIFVASTKNGTVSSRPVCGPPSPLPPPHPPPRLPPKHPSDIFLCAFKSWREFCHLLG